MADLKERQNGKALVELSAKAGEDLVGEEDIALDLLCYRIHRARVLQAERISPRLEGVVCVQDGVHEAICPHRRRDGCCYWRRDLDFDRDSYFFQRRCCRHIVRVRAAE